jgi:hypothetical protein
MSVARWGDPREQDTRGHCTEWPRVYDVRDRDEHDPRDALMRDLDLPRSDEREVMKPNPPAQPGALNCEPLKAAIGALTRPSTNRHRLGGASHLQSPSWSRRASSCSCFWMYSRMTRSSRPTVDTK